MEAWKQWSGSVDFEDLDTGSYRLLPLLYKNLESHQVSGPIHEKLKGIFRHTFVTNQFQFKSLQSVLRALQLRKIPVILMTDAFLMAKVYENVGLRPHNHLSILIHPSCIADARDIFQSLGWRALFEPDSMSRRMQWYRGITLTDPDEHAIELQWRVLDDESVNGDRSFRDHATRESVFDAEAMCPDAADVLLQIIVDGIKWNEVAPFRWIADACSLLDKFEVNWDYFYSQTIAYKKSLVVQRGLRYLNELKLIHLPESVLLSVNGFEIDPVEKKVFQFVTTAARPLSLLNRVLYVQLDYLKLTGRLTVVRHPVQFARYLANRWGLNSLAAVFNTSLRKIVHRRG